MRRFKSAKQAQRFLSAFGPICIAFKDSGAGRRSQQKRERQWALLKPLLMRIWLLKPRLAAPS